jgi:hypothetical protein
LSRKRREAKKEGERERGERERGKFQNRRSTTSSWSDEEIVIVVLTIPEVSE